MKKQLIIAAIAAGAGVLVYFAIWKKYNRQRRQPGPQKNSPHYKHHLTNAFTVAKKHATHAG